jgi:hypothetical protein
MFKKNRYLLIAIYIAIGSILIGCHDNVKETHLCINKIEKLKWLKLGVDKSLIQANSASWQEADDYESKDKEKIFSQLQSPNYNLELECTINRSRVVEINILSYDSDFINIITNVVQENKFENQADSLATGDKYYEKYINDIKESAYFTKHHVTYSAKYQ